MHPNMPNSRHQSGQKAWYSHQLATESYHTSSLEKPKHNSSCVAMFRVLPWDARTHSPLLWYHGRVPVPFQRCFSGPNPVSAAPSSHMNGDVWNPPGRFNPLKSDSGVSPSPQEWLGTHLLHIMWVGCIPTCQIRAIRVVKQHGTAPNWQQNHITSAVWRSLIATGLMGQCSWYSPGL
jgi:hypothetical protein